jgi:hypothetical protein
MRFARQDSPTQYVARTIKNYYILTTNGQNAGLEETILLPESKTFPLMNEGETE